MCRVSMTALPFSDERQYKWALQASRLRIDGVGTVTLSQLATFMKRNASIQTITLENGVVFAGWMGDYVQELDIDYVKVLKQVRFGVDADGNRVLTLVDHAAVAA